MGYVSGINTASLKELGGGGVKFPRSPPHGTAYIWFRLEMNSWLDSLMNPQDSSLLKAKWWSWGPVYILGFQQIFQRGSYYFLKFAKIKTSFSEMSPPHLKKKKKSSGTAGHESQTWITKTKKSHCPSQYFAGAVLVQGQCVLEQWVWVLGRGKGKENEKATQSVLRQSWKQLSSTHINFLPQTVLTEPFSIN